MAHASTQAAAAPPSLWKRAAGAVAATYRLGEFDIGWVRGNAWGALAGVLAIAIAEICAPGIGGACAGAAYGALKNLGNKRPVVAFGQALDGDSSRLLNMALGAGLYGLGGHLLMQTPLAQQFIASFGEPIRTLLQPALDTAAKLLPA